MRNRLALSKVTKMSQVRAQIRRKHLAHGFVAARSGRKNHKESRVDKLLAVPRYADALDGEAVAMPETDASDEPEAVRTSALVTSAAAWRRELARWKASSDDDERNARAAGSKRNKGFFPRSLALLFGGTAKRPATVPTAAEQRQRWSKEQLCMELLQAEWDGKEPDGEEPDNGAQEGSGDEYEP